jgi:hypothetical protein
LLIALTSFPVGVCIDGPHETLKNTITAGTCIQCKMRVEDSFYAIGCNGRQYTLNMSAWALLNVSECK